jgi:hypothetical protein
MITVAIGKRERERAPAWGGGMAWRCQGAFSVEGGVAFDMGYSIRLRRSLSLTRSVVRYNQVGGSPIDLVRVSADAGNIGRIHQCDVDECGAFLPVAGVSKTH